MKKKTHVLHSPLCSTLEQSRTHERTHSQSLFHCHSHILYTLETPLLVASDFHHQSPTPRSEQAVFRTGLLTFQPTHEKMMGYILTKCPLNLKFDTNIESSGHFVELLFIMASGKINPFTQRHRRRATWQTSRNTRLLALDATDVMVLYVDTLVHCVCEENRIRGTNHMNYDRHVFPKPNAISLSTCHSTDHCNNEQILRRLASEKHYGCPEYCG